MSTGEDNKAVVRDCFENASTGTSTRSRRSSARTTSCTPRTSAAWTAWPRWSRRIGARIADLRITIDQQFTEGDHVATRYTIRGTHRATDGRAADRRDVEFTGITISRCRDGRIEEEWEIVDVMSLLAQIGQLPEPSTV